MKDYSSRQSKHYDAHKDEAEHPEPWSEIRTFWNGCVNGTKDLSSKEMVGRVMACRDTFAQSVGFVLSLFTVLILLGRRQSGAMLRASRSLDASFTLEMTRLPARLRVSFVVLT